jgi:hypothetical protein
MQGLIYFSFLYLLKKIVNISRRTKKGTAKRAHHLMPHNNR